MNASKRTVYKLCLSLYPLLAESTPNRVFYRPYNQSVNVSAGVYSAPLPLQGDASTTRGAEAKDVEAVVRQPRRGGRAAHREAAEPVL